MVLFVMVSVLLGPAVDPNNPTDGVLTGIALVVGSFASGIAGYVGELTGQGFSSLENHHVCGYGP